MSIWSTFTSIRSIRAARTAGALRDPQVRRDPHAPCLNGLVTRISILLTDIQLPGMGGEELAGIAATSRPDLRVVFASGSIRPSADAAFLQKPYKTADLVGLLPPVR
jgi:CheY-like chemotaxis protein